MNTVRRKRQASTNTEYNKNKRAFATSAKFGTTGHFHEVGEHYQSSHATSQIAVSLDEVVIETEMLCSLTFQLPQIVLSILRRHSLSSELPPCILGCDLIFDKFQLLQISVCSIPSLTTFRRLAFLSIFAFINVHEVFC